MRDRAAAAAFWQASRHTAAHLRPELQPAPSVGYSRLHLCRVLGARKHHTDFLHLELSVVVLADLVPDAAGEQPLVVGGRALAAVPHVLDRLQILVVGAQLLQLPREVRALALEHFVRLVLLLGYVRQLLFSSTLVAVTPQTRTHAT